MIAATYASKSMKQDGMSGDAQPPARPRELECSDVDAALTKLLRHGYGLLTIKVHGHRIMALEATTRQTCNGAAKPEQTSESH